MDNNPKFGMKQILILLTAILLLVGSWFLWSIYGTQSSGQYKLQVPTVMGTERYKIVGSVMLPSETKRGELEPGFILHLDDGRTKYIAVPQAARDNDLLNINEGYLYRINGQFYLKKN